MTRDRPMTWSEVVAISLAGFLFGFGVGGWAVLWLWK